MASAKRTTARIADALAESIRGSAGSKTSASVEDCGRPWRSLAGARRFCSDPCARHAEHYGKGAY